MERKIGEIFEFEGVKLQVVESSNCGLNNTSCYFLDDEGDYYEISITTGKCRYKDFNFRYDPTDKVFINKG